MEQYNDAVQKLHDPKLRKKFGDEADQELHDLEQEQRRREHRRLMKADLLAGMRPRR